MDNDLFYSKHKDNPLAEMMRPKSFGDFSGQEHILSKGKLLRRAIDADRLPSIILWGPPGCGKTTLAEIIATKTNSSFCALSAVSSGKTDAKEVVNKASERRDLYDKKTILFVDEIHRFNKAQQDFFLPFIENGVITFIGATTENPSFEVNSPLLSRARVFHLRELSAENIRRIIKKAVKKINSGAIQFKTNNQIDAKIVLENKALAHISNFSEGDARDALNSLELAILSTKPINKIIKINEEIAKDAIQEKFVRYDKGADGHYDAISALHKSLRSSDVDASLHYLLRMLEAGEDPLYIMRRLVRFASEDIGMADPKALEQTVACQQAVHFIGMPESGIIMAQAVIYLANASKSRAVDEAYLQAQNDIKNLKLDPIPLEIRNAPTKMMKDFGFGKNYKMHDTKSRLPENLKGKKYWHDK